jgi:hypothetical protein
MQLVAPDRSYLFYRDKLVGYFSRMPLLESGTVKWHESTAAVPYCSSTVLPSDGDLDCSNIFFTSRAPLDLLSENVSIFH